MASPHVGDAMRVDEPDGRSDDAGQGIQEVLVDGEVASCRSRDDLEQPECFSLAPVIDQGDCDADAGDQDGTGDHDCIGMVSIYGPSLRVRLRDSR